MPAKIMVPREDLIAALVQTCGARHRAASILGISPATLRSRIHADPSIIRAVNEPGAVALQEMIPHIKKLGPIQGNQICDDNGVMYKIEPPRRMSDDEARAFLARAISPTVVS